jgi:hypothetical protein
MERLMAMEYESRKASLDVLKRRNINKSKRIPSIFNDESTESFICLRRHIHVTLIAAMRIILRVLVVFYLRVTCMFVAQDL